MIILGIETSCDETAVSLLEMQVNDGVQTFKVLNNAVLSQIKLHEQYGGVFPMMAKREHAKNLVPLLANVLKETKLTQTSSTTTISEAQIVHIKELLGDKEKELLNALLKEPTLHTTPSIDAIAVTSGPGLEPALWVGVNFAKALHILWNIPVIPINHMEGHIVASLLKKGSDESHLSLNALSIPALALLISGGHSELVLIKNMHEYEVIGRTRDDALGEAFDKVARLLDMPYPGGPHISHLAAAERKEHKVSRNTYVLPRPMIHSNDYDFSFSGIKTAVLYTIRHIAGKEQNGERTTNESAGALTEDIKKQIAREFEDAVAEVLIAKTKKAIEEYGVETLIVGGGVIANTYIREQLTILAKNSSISLLLPETGLSTDNALMIALAGALRFHGEPEKNYAMDFKAEGNLSL